MLRDVARLAEREHDLIVIGAGICGAAAAWDAAQRGLSVALVEGADFGAGVSWNSMKTIHGGFRHLQRGDVASLRESMRERRALLRIAAAIVRPLPFLVPSHGAGSRALLATALRVSDGLARDRNEGLPPEQQIPASRRLSAAEVAELLPGVPRAGLSGGVVWTDAQVTAGERLIVGFVQAAAGAGAAVVNHAETVGLLRCGSRVNGARVLDRETGATIDVRGRSVLIAAGAGLDRLLGLAGIRRPPVPLLRAINLVVSRPAATSHAVGARGDGRFLFLVPWRGRAIVGTDYAPAEAPGEPHPAAFLGHAAQAFPWAGLRPEDVSLVHSGLVPGRGGAAGLWTRSRLLDHEAEDGVPGLFSALAVKYTTGRALAEQAVDRVVARLGARVAPCRTAVTPLPAARELTGTLEERTRHAVREEMARTLADVALRRLDLGTGGPPAAAELEVVAHALAAERGLSSERLAQERGELDAVYRTGIAAIFGGREPA